MKCYSMNDDDDLFKSINHTTTTTTTFTVCTNRFLLYGEKERTSEKNESLRIASGFRVNERKSVKLNKPTNELNQ